MKPYTHPLVQINSLLGELDLSIESRRRFIDMLNTPIPENDSHELILPLNVNPVEVNALALEMLRRHPRQPVPDLTDEQQSQLEHLREALSPAPPLPTVESYNDLLERGADLLIDQVPALLHLLNSAIP